MAGEIAIVLSDDCELRALNRRWRGLDRATDVLSFPYEDVGPAAGRSPARRRRVSGDLVISLDRVAEQAVRFRVSRGEELARLVVHGTLHLAGLDHHRAGERRHMWAQEDQALRAARAHARKLNVALASRTRAGAATGSVPPPRRPPRSAVRDRAGAASATGRRRSR